MWPVKGGNVAAQGKFEAKLVGMDLVRVVLGKSLSEFYRRSSDDRIRTQIIVGRAVEYFHPNEPLFYL
jgi:hypothetical protein